MKKIYLTGRNGAGRFALVDDIDYDRCVKHKWHAGGNNDNSYAVTRWKRYRQDGTPYWSNLSMHRLIMGQPKDTLVDHINRLPLDNRRNNLRLCDRSQNAANTGLAVDNTSGYRGVSFDNERMAWRSYIVTGSKRTDIGRFSNKHVAALAYNLLADRYWGEFAVLNEIKSEEIAHIDQDVFYDQITSPVVLSSRNTTGFRGIQPRNGRWRGHIKAHGSHISLPTCDTPEEAAYIYDQYALQLFGDNALVSVIDREDLHL